MSMSILGNVPILRTMRKFPAGVMVIPLLAGCLVNTFFPDLLTIGGFTTGLFKGGIQTLIGLFLFCSGATIDVKMAGRTIYVGVVLTCLKFFLGFGLGLLVRSVFGEAGLLGLSSLAIIGAVTNSNGVIYATLANEYGEESDVGATSILALNDGPFFTMIALGASGLGTFPVKDMISCMVPMILGFIVGNLDHEWRKILAPGMVLTAYLAYTVVLKQGYSWQVALAAVFLEGLIFIALSLTPVREAIFNSIPRPLKLGATWGIGLISFVIYSLLRRRPDPMGAAIGTTAGVAASTPAAIAASDPSFEGQVETASAQIAASVVLTAILCPLMVSFLTKWSDKWFEKRGKKRRPDHTEAAPPEKKS